MNPKRYLALLLLAAAVILVQLNWPASAQQNTLRYAEELAPRIVNPVFTTTMSEVRVNELLFDSLFRENYELQVAPHLVEEYRFKRGSTTMDVTLKAGLKWSDGTPISAKDVEFTVKALQDKKTLSPNARLVSFIKEVRVTGERTLQIEFVKAQQNPEQKLVFKLMPAHKFVDTFIKRSDTFKNKPVGTGPYVLVTYGDDNSVTFERNPNYREPLSITNLIMKEIPDKSQQANLLKFESLDLVIQVLPKDVAALEKNRKIELYPYQTNSWWYFGMNQKNPHLMDRKVREAIARAVNIEELLKPIGTGDILSGPFVKASPYYNHEVYPRTQDLASVDRLLTEAGYVKKTGFWEKKGKKLTLRLSANRSLESAKEVVLNFQSQMQKVGITVEPRFETDANWQKVVWRDRDFDMVLSQWTFDAKEDIYELFHTSGGKNFIGYSNKEVDALLDKGLATADPQARKQIYRDAHKMLSADLPYLFLWSLDSYSAISARVENVTIHPFYYFTFIRDWVMK